MSGSQHWPAGLPLSHQQTLVPGIAWVPSMESGHWYLPGAAGRLGDLPNSESTMPLIDDIVAMEDELLAWRREIHAHPELGFEENRPADFVAAKLEEFGIEVHRGIGKTGVVGVLKVGNETQSVGLRADMDALPILEANTFDHRSRHDGTMHASGHAGHTPKLLGAAR